MKAQQILFIGAMLGALGVALGAFGAHWLESAVERWGLSPEEQARRLHTWEVAVRYQLYHALALVAVGVLSERSPRALLGRAAVFFLGGVLVFSGCLYALVLTGVKILGAVVPLGGLCFIVGWVLLALGARQPALPAPSSREEA